MLNFFSDIGKKNRHHKAWENLSQDEAPSPRGGMDIPVIMELELKLLYTSSTGSCGHFLFVET
jgi:hypothetical protein